MATEPQGLLHITHARQDEDWVQGVLVPALGLTDDQVWTSDEADPGALKLEALEDAVEAHRYTLLIASSAARVDQWAQLAARLAEHLGVEEDKPRLLLAALDFEPSSERARELLPLAQRCLDCFDCSGPERTAAALARLAAQLKVTTTPEPPKECPYPGLRMFGTDAPGSFQRLDLFFGRDDEGRAIIDKLRADPGRVLLVGPSGCGKSSLVRARVLPALVQGADAMAYAVTRPGARPDAALCAALDALDPRLRPATDAYLATADTQAALTALAAATATAGPGRLLFLDQLEEVFHQGDAGVPGEHARFFARLTALGRVPGLALLLGMRADFYGDLMHSPAWDDFKDHRVELAPLRGAALRPAITRPAEAVGVYVEPDLVERLVREADQDRAAEALPLLQVALEQLWPLRQWRYLSLASYERLADGERRGLDVVLARHADACIRALPEPEQVLARRVLIDLVQLGEGRPDTRRRRTVGELRRAGDDARALAHVLDHLAQQRLIVVSAEASPAAVLPAMAVMLGVGGAQATERHVDLAHDTLITGWPALTGWVAKRRDDLRTQRRLEARAAGGGLLAASELPEFTRWVAHVATPEGKAIGASEALLALVRRSVASRRTWRITLAVGLAGLIAVLAVAAAVSLWQRGIARDEAAEADRQRKEAAAERDNGKRLLVRSAETYQETGRQLLLEGRALESIPYLVEARRAGAEKESLQMLFSAATRQLPIMLMEHPAGVRSAALSLDGTRLVTASAGGTARVWDAASGKPLSPPLEHEGGVLSTALSPDGTRVVTTSNHHTMRIWNATTGEPLGPLLSLEMGADAEADPSAAARLAIRQERDTRGARSVVFSRDGMRIVTISGDHIVQAWDVSTGKPLGSALEHQGTVHAVALSPDGTSIVTASGGNTTRTWSTTTGEPLSPPSDHHGRVLSVVFSPDGIRALSAVDDRVLRVWNVAADKPLGSSFEHRGAVRGAFSPDGTRVITVSDDHTMRVWDASTGEPLSPPLGEASSLVISASSDGTRVVTVSESGSVSVWDIATSNLPSPPLYALEHQGIVNTAAFSPDGTRVVTASDDNTARVWDVSTGKPLSPTLEHGEQVRTAAFSPDGTRVVTASADKTARVWDASTGGRSSPPLQHQERVRTAAFSPDGTRVVTVSDGNTAHVWNASTGEPISSPLADEHGDEMVVNGAAFSPDGTRIITSSGLRARIWDASTGKPLGAVIDHLGVAGAAFSPDGARVVTVSSDKTAHIWDASTGKQLCPPLVHQREVSNAVFDASGARVITSSQDNTARVWDAFTGQPLTPLLEHQRDLTGSTSGGKGSFSGSSAAFSPDGTRIATVGNDQRARVWDASTGKPLGPPLVHGQMAQSAAFSPDGTLVLTTSDHAAYVWTLPLDRRPLPDWEAALTRTPYVLVNGVLSPRIALTPPSSAP